MHTSAATVNAGLFDTESALVDQFIALIGLDSSPWGSLQITTEWDYRTGITDVLARTTDGRIVAFEAKLSDWRRAAHQAYRNTTFATRAYVVLPSVVAERIRVHEQVFERYGVGLCSVNADNIKILIEARETKPLLPWLYERAQTFFNAVSYDSTTAHQPREGCNFDLQST